MEEQITGLKKLVADFKIRHKDEGKASEAVPGVIKATVVGVSEIMGLNFDEASDDGIVQATRRGVRLRDATGEVITLKLWREDVKHAPKEGTVIKLKNAAINKWVDRSGNPHIELGISNIGDIEVTGAPSLKAGAGSELREPPPPEEQAEPSGPSIWDIKDKGASVGGCLHDAATIVAALIRVSQDLPSEIDKLGEMVFTLAKALEEHKAAYIEEWATGGRPKTIEPQAEAKEEEFVANPFAPDFMQRIIDFAQEKSIPFLATKDQVAAAYAAKGIERNKFTGKQIWKLCHEFAKEVADRKASEEKKTESWAFG